MSTWPNRGASGGPCGGLEEEKDRTAKDQSDHVGLTQANRPPRNPVRFKTLVREAIHSAYSVQTYPRRVRRLRRTADAVDKSFVAPDAVSCVTFIALWRRRVCRRCCRSRAATSSP